MSKLRNCHGEDVGLSISINSNRPALSKQTQDMKESRLPATEWQREAISTPLFGAILPPPPLFYNPPPPSALEPPILSSPFPFLPSSSNYFSLSPLLKGTLFGERLKAAARTPARQLLLQQNMMPAQRHSWPRAAKAERRGSVSIICRSIWYSLPGLFA